MCKFNPKNDSRFIDPCMVALIEYFKKDKYIKTLGSCCGHGKYPMTLIVKNNHGNIYELISSKNIPRKKQFYKKDKQGYYYIPETIQK